MARDRQQAAQMRSSQIRTLKMLHGAAYRVIASPVDVKTIQDIIDKQLASMGAETFAEYQKRSDEFWAKESHTDEEFKEFQKPFGGKKKYKLTSADIKRYNHW